MTSPMIIAITLVITGAFGQSTPSTDQWLDPFVDGKPNNPGARIQLSKKSIDAVHNYTADAIGRTIQAVTLSDFVLNVGTGTLTIGPPRVNEVTLGRYDYQLVPSNRIRTQFVDGRLLAGGIWQYKPAFGQPIGSTYEASVTKMGLNATNEIGRSIDGKPTIKTNECKADLGQHRIEVKNVVSQFSVIENCKLEFCMKIREHFEKAFCDIFASFVKDMINSELQEFPNRIAITGEQHKIDYSLVSSAPTVLKDQTLIRADLEGKYVCNSVSNVPFNPPEMTYINRDRMLSFQLSDYTFNTLLHQAHVFLHKYSTASIASSASLQQLLSLNCGSPSVSTTPTSLSTTPKASARASGNRVQGPKVKSNQKSMAIAYAGDLSVRASTCLGAMFDGFANFGPYSSSDIGEIVYKSNQKAPSVYVKSGSQGYFDGGIGSLEVYGPSSKHSFRQLVARVDVRVMRGVFEPKVQQNNITGSIKLTALKLAQPAPQNRMITDQWLDRFAQFVMPVLDQIFNQNFDRLAQFPLPIPQKYACISPEFSVQTRTMQIDCDVHRISRCYKVCCGNGFRFCCD